MKRAATRLLTNLRRRKRLKTCPRLCRWSNNCAGATDVMETLQSVMWKLTMFCVASFHLLCMALSVEFMAQEDPGADLDAIADIIELHHLNLVVSLELMTRLRAIDSQLFDILAAEDALPKQMTPRKNLRINDLSDPEAHRLTRFYAGQLRQLYRRFGFSRWARNQNNNNGDERLKFYTGHTNQNNIQCCYRIHPEEAFLFMMMKIATGLDNQYLVDNHFGGDYARWSYIYRGTLKYIDTRYTNIIGHQVLARYVNQFPHFHATIQEFCRRGRWRQELNSDWTWIPGLELLPLDIIGFIDNSIDRISVPHSGPCADGIGAARKEDYDEMQRAFYTGYKKYHALKYETILMPNGLSTLFGPVSGRHSDLGVLVMSQVNTFLTNLQNGLFNVAEGPVFYSVLGDSAYRAGGWRCIQSYYRALNGAELQQELRDVNYFLKAARMTIEKSYGMVSGLFHVCTNLSDQKLAKEKPYACEQLRVCHLLFNCYVCLNHDQASSTSTFGCSPPSLKNYLKL